jgi:DNA-binding CsgD family transcriptional regulator
MGKQSGALTARQREIVELAMQGLSDTETAAKLGISAETVRGHWRDLRSRFGGANRALVMNLVRSHYASGLFKGNEIEINRAGSDVDLPDVWLAVLNALDLAVAIVWGQKGEIILVNEALHEMMGGEAPYSKSKEEYRQWKGYRCDGTEMQTDEWPVVQSLQTRLEAYGDVYFQRPDGTWVFAGVRALPIVDGPEVLGALAILTLIREGQAPPRHKAPQ